MIYCISLEFLGLKEENNKIQKLISNTLLYNEGKSIQNLRAFHFISKFIWKMQDI